MSPVELAIPVFSGFILLESLASAARRDGRHDWKDTLANVAVGWGSVVANVGWVFLTYSILLWIHVRAPYHVPTHALWAWSLVFLLEDLCYYWFHRVSHRSRLLWAAHVAHHSSTRYNFSTAVRQAWTHGLLGWIFWAPLAAIGFHPFAILIMQAFSLIYQFFVHTQYVGSLGPLEWVLNTPSHHRVHHGVNVEYLDKNYGGVLILWDRLFGTFEPEGAPAVYGITKPLRSYNPFVIALVEYVALARDLLGARSAHDAAGFLVGEPAFRPGQRLWVREAATGRRFSVRGALVSVLVIAALAPLVGAVGEGWVRRVVAEELASERDRSTGLSGVLEETGVLASGVAVSRVAYRAPDSLFLEAVSPEAIRGDVLALEAGTLELYSRQANVLVRVRNVPREDVAGRKERLRALVDRSTREYAFESAPETLLGRSVVRWTATPFAAGPPAKIWLDRELGWPLRVEWDRYAFAFLEVSATAPATRWEAPASASVVEWDLASRALGREEAAALADFRVAEPRTDLPLTRIVRAGGHWPPRICLVHRDGPFFLTVSEEKDRGVAPDRGMPVALSSGRGLLSFAGELVFLSFQRDGVSLSVVSNLPAPEVLRIW